MGLNKFSGKFIPQLKQGVFFPQEDKGIMLLVSEVKKKLKHFEHSPQEIKKILSDIANNPEYIGDMK